MSPTYAGDRAATLFPVIAYAPDEQLFILNDRTLGFAFQCIPLSGCDEGFQARLQNFLNAEWPTDTLMQCCLYASDNVFDHLNRFRYLRREQSDPLFTRLTDNRVRFLRKQSVLQGPTAPVRHLRLVISFSIPIRDPVPTADELQKTYELQIYAQKSLTELDLQPQALDNTTYLHVLDDLLHHGSHALWQDNQPREAQTDRTLNHQVLDEDKALIIDDEGLWIGPQRVKTLSVKRWPDQAYKGFGLQYIGDLLSGDRGIKGPFCLCATIIFPDAQRLKTGIDQKRQFTVAQATGPLQKFVPVIHQKQRGLDMLTEALDHHDRPLKMALFVVVFGHSEAEALAASAGARSYFSEFGVQLIADRYFILPFFLNSLPLVADRRAVKDLFRYKTMATRHAAVLLPLYADWRGTGTPVMDFRSRRGQIMTADLFDSGTNYNACIAAESGAGKSFLTNDMISNYLSIGGKAWVIDVGRSYEGLCSIYGGDFMDFSAESEIGLNPFELIKDFKDEIDMLVGLVSAMAAPTQSLSDHQSANLKRVMTEVWSHLGHQMTIDHIEQALLDSPDQRIRDIGEQLFSFTSKGDYGRYFNGRNTVDFQNRFTVLELDYLQGREHLMQVVLLQLIYQIQQDMYLGHKDRRKLVIIDEAWSMLTRGNVATFIEHGYRRFRKYGGAAVTVTQSVMDLYNNTTGEAIATNSAHIYLLQQKATVIDQLRTLKRLPISDGMYELLKTVHTSPGRYSEICLLTPYGQGIGRLIVDPFQQLLYSTKPEDTHAIDDRTAQGMTIAEAIEAILAERSAQEACVEQAA